MNNIIILVGGYGKRLGLLTKKKPKPLIEFNKKPFLDYLLFEITKLKPKKIILLCSYKNEFFIKKYNKGFNGTKIKCVIENKPLGTGGALFNAKRYITDNTLICNGDTFFQVGKIKNKLANNYSLLQIFINTNTHYKSNKKLSQLSINNNKIFFSKNSNYMNSGIYFVNKGIKKYLKKNVNSFEDDILPKLINLKLVTGKHYKGNHFDIGTKKNILIFKKYLKKSNSILPC
jgi:NDP-sugar pyrophosphorylase family protein